MKANKSVKCEAGNAQSSGAIDFNLQLSVHVVPLFRLILSKSGQAFYWSTILVIIDVFIGMRP